MENVSTEGVNEFDRFIRVSSNPPRSNVSIQ